MNFSFWPGLSAFEAKIIQHRAKRDASARREGRGSHLQGGRWTRWEPRLPSPSLQPHVSLAGQGPLVPRMSRCSHEGGAAPRPPGAWDPPASSPPSSQQREYSRNASTAHSLRTGLSA